MKKIITIGITVVGLCASQISHAQGTMTYLSNLGTSAGGAGVGSNSWLSVLFATGTNSEGYMLDSVQMKMADAFSNPSGFTVMLYSGSGSATSSLGVLSGSDPLTGGIYTYIPTTEMLLMPLHIYSLVVIANTPYVNPATVNPIGYLWDGEYNTISQHNPVGGWTGSDGYSYSADYGLTWNYVSGVDPQYSITATPVPEPCVLSLLAVGGLACFWLRRKG